MICISIISKHEQDRNAIIKLLSEQDDFRLASIGEDGYDAIKAAMTHQPDIIIMDFNMEDINSPDLTPIIKRNSPSTSIIVQCTHDEYPAVGNAFKAGISGCLFKEEGLSNLVSMVRSVYHGGLYISKSSRELMMNYFFVPAAEGEQDAKTFKTQPGLSRDFFSLTELQIFYGIIHGQTDKEIAKNLNIVTGSLRNCVNQVKKRTGLRNRTQIAVYAMLNGIIDVGKVQEKLSGDDA